jgi:hypothetical protein
VPRRLLTPGLLLLAVALGGCADGDVKEANAYVGAVNAAQGRFAATSETLLARIAPDDAPARNRAALTRFYGAVDGLVTELRRIEPPGRVRTLHGRLIAAVVRFGADLRAAGAAITSRSASRVLRGQERLARATSTVARRINATIGDINAALED